MWRVGKEAAAWKRPGKITNNCSTVLLEVLGIAAWELLPGLTCCLGCNPEQLFDCLLLQVRSAVAAWGSDPVPWLPGLPEARPRTIVQCSNVPICPDVPILVMLALEQHPSPARFCSLLLGNPSYPEQFIELCYLLLSEARILALA